MEQNQSSPSENPSMEIDLTLVSNYLNTSLNCIRNHYNRHVSQVQKGLNLLQPLSEEMKNVFQGFQNSIVLEQEIPESTPFKRYVRHALDQEIHKKEFQQWTESFETHRRENPSCPAFAELYESYGTKKRKQMSSYDDSVQQSEQYPLDPSYSHLMEMLGKLQSINL
jgi:hypothetical protein